MQIALNCTRFYIRYIIGNENYISVIKRLKNVRIRHLSPADAENTREYKESLIDMIANNFDTGHYFITLMFSDSKCDNKAFHRIATRFASYVYRHIKGIRRKRILLSEEVTQKGERHVHLFVNTDNEEFIKEILQKWEHGRSYYRRINCFKDLIEMAGYIPKAIYARNNKHHFIGLFGMGGFEKPRIKYMDIVDTSLRSNGFIPNGYEIVKDYCGVEPYTGSEFREIVAILKE